MVRKLLRPALRLLRVAALALALSGCGLFTASLFPWYLPGVTASLDLSRWIEGFVSQADLDADRWWADVAVLRDSGGKDFVFVAVGGWSGGNRLIVLDGGLSLVPATTNPIDNLPDLGRRAMMDGNDHFVIGNHILENPTLVPSGYTPGWKDQPGFSDVSSNYLLFAENSTSALLRYDGYGSTWGWQSYGAFQISSAYPDEWDLAGVAYDALRPADPVVLMLLKRPTEVTDSFIRIVYTVPPPWADFLVENNPGFTIRVRDSKRLHYTRRGIVVLDHDNRTRLFDASGTEKQSLDFAGHRDIVDAYDLDGRTFYILDKDARRLFKGSTGW